VAELPTGSEGYRAFLELRVVRALEAVRLAMPHLHPDGSVILTSGTAAYRGGAGWLLGSAASGAIISAARSLADREAMFESVGAGLSLAA
jgi:hypothetical protein